VDVVGFIGVGWVAGLDVFSREEGGLFSCVRADRVDIGIGKEKGVFVCLRPCRCALTVEEMGFLFLGITVCWK